MRETHTMNQTVTTTTVFSNKYLYKDCQFELRLFVKNPDFHYEILFKYLISLLNFTAYRLDLVRIYNKKIARIFPARIFHRKK